MIVNEIKVDRAALDDAITLFEFVGGNAADATRIAINKAGPRARTISSSKIREQVRLKARYVTGRSEDNPNGRLQFVRATRSNLVGKISTPSRGISLAMFSTDPQVANDNIRWYRPPAVPAQGIKVKVKPSGATKSVQGDPSEVTGKPFYIVARNSHILLIAQRRRNPTSRGSMLKVHSGPSLSQVFTDVKEDVTAEVADIFVAEHLSAMRYLLSLRYPPEA